MRAGIAAGLNQRKPLTRRRPGRESLLLDRMFEGVNIQGCGGAWSGRAPHAPEEGPLRSVTGNGPGHAPSSLDCRMDQRRLAANASLTAALSSSGVKGFGTHPAAPFSTTSKAELAVTDPVMMRTGTSGLIDLI